MPVHRIPGGTRGSVYALTDELDAWLGSTQIDEPDGQADELDHPGKRIPRSRLSGNYRIVRSIVAVAIAATLGFAVYAWSGLQPKEPSGGMPSDAEAAALFVDARVDWAKRRPEEITLAIAKLQRVVEIEPDFAPAYSALADCYLLAREFGSLTDVEAFGRAQGAVDTALRIDPEHAGSLRARAFIEYWWHGDRAAAARDFRRSLAINDKSAQTLFWYANALIDNGDFDEGLRRFSEARLLEAASPAIAADLAWAQWSAGETVRAKAALIELRRSHPTLATIPDYLGVIALAEGDMEEFVAEMEGMARLRGESGLTADARAFRAALDRDPDAVSRMVIENGENEVLDGQRKTLVWPAFVASASADKDALLRILQRADARNEVWGSAGLRRDIAARWAREPEIASLLKRREAPSLLIER